MSTRFLMLASLLLGLTGAARSDDPEQQEARRLREENLKLREALAEQQKRLLITQKQTEAQARDLLEEFTRLKKDCDAKSAVLVRERDVAATRLDQASVELKRLEAEIGRASCRERG